MSLKKYQKLIHRYYNQFELNEKCMGPIEDDEFNDVDLKDSFEIFDLFNVFFRENVDNLYY